MFLVSDRPLLHAGAVRQPGQPFEEPDTRIALQLIERGTVRKATPPRVHYETKVITPEAAEVSARPFRHGTVPDPESKTVAAEGDSIFSEAGLSERGAVDPGRRRRRSRSAAE
jgi:hypothetical protein